MTDSKSSPSPERTEKSSSQAATAKFASAAPSASVTEKKTRKIESFFTSQPAQKKMRAASGAGLPVASSNSSLSTLPKLNSIPFSLATFQKSLSDEEKELLQLECDTLGLSWMKLLESEIRKPYFLKLKKFLWDSGLKSAQNTPQSINIYPPAKDIYNWSKTPLGKVKVVIIGQDPYHGRGQAHGLCFSVPPGVRIPPSLVNIYEELKTEYPDFSPPKDGNLEAWANQGVLMLNTCLTVKAGEAGSHSRKGWEQFTERVVEVVDQYGGANLPSNDSGSTGVGRGIVFLAWGAWASERVSKLSKSKHLVLTSAHPSPYSANKGFFGNGHFQKANAWLEEKYGREGKVDWCCIAAQST